jgi:hypothetical protein
MMFACFCDNFFSPPAYSWPCFVSAAFIDTLGIGSLGIALLLAKRLAYTYKDLYREGEKGSSASCR